MKNSSKQSVKMDMLHGSLFDKMLMFAMPLAACSILQQLFNSVGTAVVGRFASSEALAAVGSNSSVIALMVTLFSGISLGSNVVIANYIGQNDTKRIPRVVHTAVSLALLSGVFLLILGQFVAHPILLLMGAPKDIIHLATLYLRIYFLGMPFFMLYDFGASILRSIGDTRRPMYALIVSGVVNVILNLLFVVVFHMGVAGAGLATVGANATSAVQILYFLTHEELPGSAVELNYEYFAYYLVNVFAQTVVTFTGQNYGAKDEGRCKKIFRLGMLCSVISCGILSTIFVVFRTFFIGLFTSDPSVYHYAQLRFLIVLTFEFLTSSYEISGGCLRGFGRSMTPAILTVFGSCVLRLIWLATVCNWFHDYKLLMAIYPISWVLTGTMVLVAYFRTRKKLFV